MAALAAAAAVTALAVDPEFEEDMELHSKITHVVTT